MFICLCLMVSLIYKRRALPLAFSIFKGKKGHLPEDAHVALVSKLRPLIPESTKQVIFLGDGEFDGTNLQKTLKSFALLMSHIAPKLKYIHNH